MILRSRKAPNAIAARAIVRSGTGHKYWSHFSGDIQDRIENLAKDIYSVLYVPSLETPIKTMDLPVAGRGYGAQTLPMIFDLVNLTNNVKLLPRKKSKKPVEVLPPDETGAETLKYLGKTQRIISRISGTSEGSLGLHPVLYFYNQSGNYLPSAFLGTANFVRWLDDENKFREFTDGRRRLEDFLIRHRSFVTEVIHKYGTGVRSIPWITLLYQRLLEWIGEGVDDAALLNKLSKDKDFAFLIPMHLELTESAKAKTGMKFHRKTKSAVYLSEALEQPHRCRICGGLLHRNSMTVDHIERRADGGAATVDNGQMAHPYCNTTYKEQSRAREIA